MRSFSIAGCFSSGNIDLFHAAIVSIIIADALSGFDACFLISGLASSRIVADIRASPVGVGTSGLVAPTEASLAQRRDFSSVMIYPNFIVVCLCGVSTMLAIFA